MDFFRIGSVRQYVKGLARRTQWQMKKQSGNFRGHSSLSGMLSCTQPEEGDRKLIEACKNSGRVVSAEYIDYSAEYITDGGGTGYIDPYYIKSVEKPINYEYSALGFVNTDIGSDGMVRSVRLTDDYNGEELQSLAYRAYTQYCQFTGQQPNTPVTDRSG